MKFFPANGSIDHQFGGSTVIEQFDFPLAFNFSLTKGALVLDNVQQSATYLGQAKSNPSSQPPASTKEHSLTDPCLQTSGLSPALSKRAGKPRNRVGKPAIPPKC